MLRLVETYLAQPGGPSGLERLIILQLICLLLLMVRAVLLLKLQGSLPSLPLCQFLRNHIV